MEMRTNDEDVVKASVVEITSERDPRKEAIAHINFELNSFLFVDCMCRTTSQHLNRSLNVLTTFQDFWELIQLNDLTNFGIFVVCLFQRH